MKNKIILLAMSLFVFSPAFARPTASYAQAAFDIKEAVKRSEGMKLGKCEIFRTEKQMGDLVFLLDYDFAKPTPDWADFRSPDGIIMYDILKYTIRDATYKNQIVASYTFKREGGGNLGPDDYTNYYHWVKTQILVSKKTGKIVKIENEETMHWAKFSAQFFPRTKRTERHVCEN